MNELTWVEISKEALTNNIQQFRTRIGKDKILCPCVKANAYGHGLIECGKIFLEAGADWLSVNSVYEARALRDAGVEAPIYILGYVPLESLEEAVELECRLVVYNKETVEKLGEIGKDVKIHLKAETGNNRQGLLLEELVELAKYANESENIEVEGLATHFANIEDTTDNSFAEKQITEFEKIDEALKAVGIEVPIKHTANSAATILFPKTHYEMVRTGISNYGMWPSNETYVSCKGILPSQDTSFDSPSLRFGVLKEVKENGFELKPAFTWKAKIAQIKVISEGQYIGYGCTYKTTRETKLAIIPVGYYDGYDRGVSGKAHVLIKGKRASLRGRVCMNIIMADVSDIPEAELEGEVILIDLLASPLVSFMSKKVIQQFSESCHSHE